MRVTPLDIIQKSFAPNKKGGFDPNEVAGFLDEVREAFEELIRQNHEQKGALDERDREIARLRSEEDAVKETLMIARKFAEEMGDSAKKEADLLLGEARLDAQRVLTEAHDEHRDLLNQVLHLKSLRVQLVTGIRATLETHTRMLDEVEELLEADGQEA
jgi:cell division initiation protein